MTKNRQVQTCLHLQKDKNFNELFRHDVSKKYNKHLFQ